MTTYTPTGGNIISDISSHSVFDSISVSISVSISAFDAMRCDQIMVELGTIKLLYLATFISHIIYIYIHSFYYLFYLLFICFFICPLVLLIYLFIFTVLLILINIIYYYFDHIIKLNWPYQCSGSGVYWLLYFWGTFYFSEDDFFLLNSQHLISRLIWLKFSKFFSELFREHF